MKSWIWLALATVAVTALLWGVGELHRQNCFRSGRVACSVLPWQNGHARDVSGSGSAIPDTNKIIKAFGG